MGLSFEIRLEERRPDAVRLSVLLDPQGKARVDAVSLDLLCGSRKTVLSPRVLLPIAGELHGIVISQAEIRADGPIPEGAVVVGTAFCGTEQVIARCPADPRTGLEGHVRGTTALIPPGGAFLETLPAGDRRKLGAAFPWLNCCPKRPPPHLVDAADVAVDALRAEVDAALDGDDLPDADGICDELGLDGEDAAWLKDLLADDP